MDETNKNEREPKEPKAKRVKKTSEPIKKEGWKSNVPHVGPGNFWNNLVAALALLLALTFLYSYTTSDTSKPAETTLSAIAEDAKQGLVKGIIVKGDTLEVTYTDETRPKGEAKKELDAAITDTLMNLGVNAEQVSKVAIDVQDESGVRFWLLTLAPFLFPVILIGFFAWFFLRQMKGAGVQALNFGSSKARIIDPNDLSQKVTFKDVAGAKEAKNELEEIVDFLKNPKKFLDIGAQIPKGVLLMGAPGTGKCVVGDTRVLTSKGLFPIEEVPLHFGVDAKNEVEGLSVCSVDPNTLTMCTARASHWYDLGEQKTLRVHSDIGITLEGTPEHPVVVVDQKSGQLEFKHLSNITPGECVVVAYDTGLFGTHTKIEHPDIAYLLGVLVGDGCMTTKNRIVFSSADPEIVERMQTITQKYFGLLWRKTKSRPYDYEITNAELKSKIMSFGLMEGYADHKHIPHWVCVAPRECVAAFLKGLFDTDGYVEKHGAVGLSSASRELIGEVHAILLNLGIVSRIHSRKKKYNNKLQYYITVYGDFLDAFNTAVGFTVAHKRERLESLILRQRNTNINLIPHQSTRIQSVWNDMRVHAHAGVHFDREFYSTSLYKNFKRYASGDRNPSLGGMQTFIAGMSELAPTTLHSSALNYLQKLSSGKFFFTHITSKEEGYARVYDLTVPQSHNFVANGLINHNTLLARAVAGEAGVPFFSISGSEFVEMFVGVGASRVRDLFRMAKKTAPSIIFVDEIDAVGRVRGTGVGGGNDEREQTLNQILVEMDGFEPNEKVIVMAATNRPDVLDPALLRPGRFDRRVVIDVPDRNDREAIMKIHARKKPLAADVDLSVIAQRTPGFSGADLYSLMNEAAIYAAREDRKEVMQSDLIKSIEKVMLGPERKSHVLSSKEREITAYHEAGHALVSSLLPYADPVHKISIISRGRAAGYTLKLPTEDRRMQSRKEFEDDIAVTLAGYITEKMVFGDLTTGPSNDLQVLTALARDMVTKYGMSDAIGPMALESGGGRPLFGGGVDGTEFSEKVSEQIDGEVKKLIDTAYAKAEKILIENHSVLDAIAKKLLEVENLERAEYEALLKEHNVTMLDHSSMNLEDTAVALTGVTAGD